MTKIDGFRPKRGGRRRVAVLAFDGVVLADLAPVCEMFARARDAKGAVAYEVRVCSPAPRVGTEHLGLEVPWRLGSVAAAHTVIVPGVERLDPPPDPSVLNALRRAAARGARVASVCTGAFVLAAAGLLDGRRATTHWRAAAALGARFPEVEVDPDVLYVDEGDILTSAGACAGLDLCLHLVRTDLGALAAAHTARASVMPLERAGGQAQYILHEPPRPEGDSMAPLLAWLEANLHRALDVPTIAARAKTSVRTLNRRFRAQTGITPSKWLTLARVRRAQQLLESTGLSVEAVAEEVGFGSAGVLRERFSPIVGTSPQGYRRTFRAG